MDDRPRPIHSALGEDPAQTPALEAFIVGLAERVDELQDCEAQGTLARLAERAGALAADAVKLGYGPLADRAEAVRRSSAEHNAQDTRKALIELTEVAYRVRLGHRGAV